MRASAQRLGGPHTTWTASDSHAALGQLRSRLEVAKSRAGSLPAPAWTDLPPDMARAVRSFAAQGSRQASVARKIEREIEEDARGSREDARGTREDVRGTREDARGTLEDARGTREDREDRLHLAHRDRRASLLAANRTAGAGSATTGPKAAFLRQVNNAMDVARRVLARSPGSAAGSPGGRSGGVPRQALRSRVQQMFSHLRADAPPPPRRGEEEEAKRMRRAGVFDALQRGEALEFPSDPPDPPGEGEHDQARDRARPRQSGPSSEALLSGARPTGEDADRGQGGAARSGSVGGSA
eukprot:2064310-Pyramimonas_sp.AAC.1